MTADTPDCLLLIPITFVIEYLITAATGRAIDTQIKWIRFLLIQYQYEFRLWFPGRRRSEKLRRRRDVR